MKRSLAALTLSAAVVLAGCAQTPPPSATANTPAPAPSVSLAPASPTSAAPAESSTSTAPSASAAKTSAPAASASTSSDAAGGTETVQQRHERELAEYAKTLGLNPPPKVDVVRTITVEEEAAVVEQCMSDAGFKPNEGGGYTAEGAKKQELNVALYTCAAQYPVDESAYETTPASQQREIYDYYVKELIPCLKGEGITVPAPPSFEEFQKRMDTPTEYNPSLAIDPSMSQDQLLALQEKCPFYAPSQRVG